MKLYGHDTSPYVRRVRVLLAEKGLPFERDSDSWTKPDAQVMRINPMLRVPVLTDGEQTLLDSKLIAAYVYERHPEPPPPPPAGHLPLQATLWHREHRWEDENTLLALDAGLDSAINVFVLELDGIRAEQSAYLGRQHERLRNCLTYIENKLAGKTCFHAGVFSALDIALVCALDWLKFRNRYPISEHAGLVAFLAAHHSRPSLAQTHPDKAPKAALPKTPSR
jgi:glutathione S-transferase